MLKYYYYARIGALFGTEELDMGDPGLHRRTVAHSSIEEGGSDMADQQDADEDLPYANISVELAKEMLDRGDSVIVDVRQPHEWTAGHVTGAIFIPVDDVMKRVDELPTDKKLLFICSVGVRSALACEMAIAMGRPPERLFNIVEGMPAWIERDFPTSYNNDP